MTRAEFATVMAYLEAACGKPLAQKSLDVYFDLLGDLSAEVLSIAAKRIAVEHKWATFPSVAELREAASETLRGEVKELSAAEAWEWAWSAVKSIDLEIEGSCERACRGLSNTVLEAMRAFGIPALVYGKEPLGVVRAQFTKIYEQLAARDRRAALLPAALKKEIAAIGQKRLPPAVAKQIEDIGQESR